MAIKYTTAKWLWKSTHRISKPQAPLKKSARATVTWGRKIVKNITNTGPQASCNDVASFVTNCGALQAALLNWFDWTSWAALILDHDTRIITLENAWFITCADLPTCPTITNLQAQINTKITCADLATSCRETIEDIVWWMVTGSTQVWIQVSYNDLTWKIDFIIAPWCWDFCNFVMSCQWIIDMMNDITDHEIRISALEVAINNIQTAWYITCATLTACAGFIDLDNRIDALEISMASICTSIMTCPWIVALQNSIDNAFVNATWTQLTSTLTFIQSDGWSIIVPLTGVATDEMVKASAGDPTPWFLDVKVKNSIEVNGNQMQLVWDILAPGANMNYKTNALWVKWRYADAGAVEQTFACAAVFPTRTCTHNLNSHPYPICVDWAWNYVVPASIIYTDANTVVVGFNAAFTGNIYIR